jgi:Predicted transcriptional regulators
MNSYSSIQLIRVNIKERFVLMEGKVENLRCDCLVIHEKIVSKVKEAMPQEENLYDLAELFKVFGDTTRIKILWALSEAEMCVCDLAFLLNMTQSAISHQLRVLKQCRLVKNRKEGKIVFYALDDEHIKGIFNQGMLHVKEG